MNLAKISSNGQITVPVEIRRRLGLKAGDKILFFQNKNYDLNEYKYDEKLALLNKKLAETLSSQRAKNTAKLNASA